jgi:hypothetical protein
MRRACLLAAFVLLLPTACGLRAGSGASSSTKILPAPSGFLDDYTLLREGGADELRWVYRNPDVDWPRYHQVMLEPVTVWRSGRGSLGPVPENDLLRLAADFENALRARLSDSYRIVAAPGPGVMRIRVAVTDAKATDPVLDVLSATREAARPHAGGALAPETRRFLAGASIEGEIRDAQTNVLMAAGVDQRVDPGSTEGVSETWDEVDRRLAFWVDRVCHRIERRTETP